MKKTFTTALAGAVLASVTACQGGGAPGGMKLIPEQATIVIGVDIGGLLKTKAYQDNKAMIESGEAEVGRDYGLFLHSLDSCLVADDDYTDFAIHRAETLLQPGDSLLLCTDGVHDALPEAIFHQLFDSMLTPAAQVERWRQAVLDAGAPDNLSLLLVRCAA